MMTMKTTMKTMKTTMKTTKTMKTTTMMMELTHNKTQSEAYKLHIKVRGSTKDSILVQWCAHSEDDDDYDKSSYDLMSPGRESDDVTRRHGVPRSPEVIISRPSYELSHLALSLRRLLIQHHHQRQLDYDQSRSDRHQDHSKKRSFQQQHQREFISVDPTEILADSNLHSVIVSSDDTNQQQLYELETRQQQQTSTNNNSRLLPILGRFRITYQAVGSNLIRYSEPIDIPRHAVTMDTAAHQRYAPRVTNKELLARKRQRNRDRCPTSGVVDTAQLHENTHYDICIELLDHAGPIKDVNGDAREDEGGDDWDDRHFGSSTPDLQTSVQDEVNELHDAFIGAELTQMKRGGEILFLPKSFHPSSSSSLSSFTPPEVTIDQRCVTGSTATGSFVLAVGSTLGAFLALALIVLIVFLAKRQKRSMAAKRGRKKSNHPPPKGVAVNLSDGIKDGRKLFRIGNVDDEDDNDDDCGVDDDDFIDKFSKRLGNEIFRDLDAEDQRKRFYDDVIIEAQSRRSSSKSFCHTLPTNVDVKENKSGANIPFILLVSEQATFAIIDSDQPICMAENGGSLYDQKSSIDSANGIDDDVIVDVHRGLDDNDVIGNSNRRQDNLQGQFKNIPTITISTESVPVEKGYNEGSQNVHFSRDEKSFEDGKKGRRKGKLMRSIGFDRGDDGCGVDSDR